MSVTCFSPIRAEIMRVTRVDSCGAPIHGAKSYVATDGFVSVESKPNYASATSYQLRGANDKYIVNQVGAVLLNWIELTITLGRVDPEMLNIMTGYPIVTDDAPTPNSIGFRVTENVAQNFALETWTDLSGSVCAGGAQQWGYALWPFVVNGQIGDVTFENGLASFSVGSAQTRNNSGWGVGPYNVNTSVATGLPIPLVSAIGTLDHMDMHITTQAPPASVCGAQTLA